MGIGNTIIYGKFKILQMCTPMNAKQVWNYTWGPEPGGQGAAAPPQILGKKFSIHSAPQILAGFVVKCLTL